MKDQLLQQISKSFAIRQVGLFASFLFHHPFIQKCWFFAIFLSFLISLFTSTSQVLAPAYQSAPPQTLEWAYHFHRHGPSGQKGPNPRYKHEEHSGGYKPWELETMVMRLWENGMVHYQRDTGMIRLSSGCIDFSWEIGDWRLIKIENIKQNWRGLEAYMLTM